MLTKSFQSVTYFNFATTNISESATRFIQSIIVNLDLSILKIIAALAILLLGFLVSAIVAALIKGILKRTEFDDRLIAKFSNNLRELENFKLEKWVPIGAFCIIFGLTLMAFLEILELRQITTPINNFLDSIYSYLPSLGAAVILIFFAWILAKTVKFLATRSIDFLRLDERLNNSIEDSRPENISLNNTIPPALYWFIILFFIPIILDTLGLQATLEPFNQLLGEFLLYLPNIFSAILIGGLGWFIAKTVRTILRTFLTSLGIDRLGAKLGINTAKTGSLSWLAGTFIYILILISTAITILNTLDIQAVSEPAIATLTQVFRIIPQIFTALIILTLGYATAKYVAELITNILTGINFNNLTFWLGLPVQISQLQNNPAAKTPSEIVGIVAMVGIMLFATVTAINVLNLTELSAILQGILIIFSSVLAGLLVLAIGLYFANLAFNLIITSGISQARILAQTARVTIIAFIGTMALQQIGIATDIVNLAFGLSLGAISVSIALAIGLGSREIAAQLVRQWLDSFKGIRG